MTMFDIFEQELIRIGHEIEVDKYADGLVVITDLTVDVCFYFQDGILESIDKCM